MVERTDTSKTPTPESHHAKSQESLPDSQRIAVISSLQIMGLLGGRITIFSPRITDETRSGILDLIAQNDQQQTANATIEVPPVCAEWEAILLSLGEYPADAIKLGITKGVPEAYLHRFAMEFVEQQIRLRNFGVISRFMQNRNFGTSEQRTHFERLIQEQERRVQAERQELADANAEDSVELMLSPDATMADFFRKYDRISEAQRDIFLDRIMSLPDGDLIAMVMALRDDSAEANTVLVRDCFSPDRHFDELVGICWVGDDED